MCPKGTRYGTLPGPIYPVVSLLPLAMNGDKLRQSSVVQVRAFRNNRFVLAASFFISSFVLFERDSSIKTWVAVAALALGSFCVYQAIRAWMELKSREGDSPAGQEHTTNEP